MILQELKPFTAAEIRELIDAQKKLASGTYDTMTRELAISLLKRLLVTLESAGVKDAV